MKSYILLFVFVVFAVNTAKALECYYCEYHEKSPLEEMPIEPDPGYIDESCKNGQKPKNDLRHECDSEEDMCLKVFIEGERSGKEIKSTLRACGSLKNYPELNNRCEDKKGSELGQLIGIGMPDTLNGTICGCTGDICNSSSMLKMTNSLIIITIGVFIFRL